MAIDLQVPAKLQPPQWVITPLGLKETSGRLKTTCSFYQWPNPQLQRMGEMSIVCQSRDWKLWEPSEAPSEWEGFPAPSRDGWSLLQHLHGPLLPSWRGSRRTPRHLGCPLSGGLQDKLLPQLLLEHGGGLPRSLAKCWSVQEQHTHVGAGRRKSSCFTRAASVVPGTGACTELLCEPPGWQAGRTSAAAGLNRRWVATRNPLWAVLSMVEQVGPALGHSHDTTQLSLRGKTPFPSSWETRWHPLSSESRQWFTHWWVS